MLRLVMIAVFSFAVIIKALASYTATGQPCELFPDPARPDILAICSADLDITLIGQRPNKVRAIAFSHPDSNQPVQTLTLTATPLIDPETVSIMFIDFNFDDHKDFAIMPRISNGENVKYLYFLYNIKTRQFEASTDMQAIVNPEIVPSEKLIRSYWRQSPSLSGWHLWQWKNGKPFIATRIEQAIKNGICSQTKTEFSKQNPTRTAPAPCP